MCYTWKGRHMGWSLFENSTGVWGIGQDYCLFKQILPYLQNVHCKVMSFIAIASAYKPRIGWSLNSWHRWKQIFRSDLWWRSVSHLSFLFRVCPHMQRAVLIIIHLWSSIAWKQQDQLHDILISFLYFILTVWMVTPFLNPLYWIL